MYLKQLVECWENHANGHLTKETYQVRLAVEDVAKLEALAEMYPKRSKEQIISELLSASLGQLEASFPYIQGTKVVATDELGDAIYEDVGPTPRYLSLAKKYLAQHKAN